MNFNSYTWNLMGITQNNIFQVKCLHIIKNVIIFILEKHLF